MIVYFVVAAVLLLLLNAVFVAYEFALIASSPARLDAMAERGGLGSRYAKEAAGGIPLQLASSQLGVTIASLLLGAVAEPAAADAIATALGSFGSVPDGLADALGVVVGLGIVVFLHLVFGEMVPRGIALSDPEGVLRVLAIPNRLWVAIFRPVIRFLNILGNAGTRLLGVEPRDELTTAHTARELASMLSRSRDEGVIEDLVHELLTGALDFGERPLRDVMLPRENVTWIGRDTTVAEAEAVVFESGHSRVVVGGTGLDDVVGFVHVKDLLTVPPGARDRPVPLARIRRLLVLREEVPLDEALVGMRRTRTHLALVVDDRRGVLGLVSLEDVLEALVGDIRDESDVSS